MRLQTRRRINATWFLLILCCLGCAGRLLAAPLTRIEPGPALVHAIDICLDAPELRSGWQGVLVQSFSGDQVLYERNADKLFLPASVNKLLTCSAALAVLGADYAYRTRILRDGELLPNGTLQGDLVLRGAGDPILSADDLRDMARAAAAAGIKRVTGNIRFDDHLFDRQWLGDSWSWDDEPYYYAAEVSALNVGKNLVEINCAPGAHPGDPVHVSVTPAEGLLHLTCTATTGPEGSKAALDADRVRGSNDVTVSGLLPCSPHGVTIFHKSLTVENPALFAAQVLKESLQRAGIAVAGRACDGPPPPSEAPIVAEHLSPTLPAILKLLNKPSDNLIAECLSKTVGAVRTGVGSGGPDGSGAQTTRHWLLSIGLDPAQFLQADGSGLSRRNYVSPRSLVRLLKEMRSRPDFPAFYDSLPIAGIDGSLRDRLKGTPAENNCHAKTGTMSHVSAVAGYVTAADGQVLTFAIMMNNHLAPASVCQAVQDKIVVLLSRYSSSAAPAP